MRQATLVFLYGPKPIALESLLRDAQKRLEDELGDRFRPYAMAQIHATLVGLERAGEDSLENARLLEIEGRREPMDIAGYLNAVRSMRAFPFTVRIGGFRPGEIAPTSRGQPLYDRSANVRGGTAVIMGWPVEREETGAASTSTVVRDSFPMTLETLRRAARSHAIRHAYHREPGDVDNDFYLRVGLVDPTADPDLARRAATRLRADLSAVDPLRLRISLNDLRLASYEDPTLPAATTATWTADEVLSMPEPGRVIYGPLASGDRA